MKNKNFYNVVNKTKLLKVFENNKVMYETYFGVKGPGPDPNTIFINFLEYPIGLNDESGNPIYPIPYNFGPYVTATGTDTGAQIRAQNDTYDGKTYDRGLRLYGTGRTFTLHVPEGFTQAEFIVESTANKQMYFNDTQVWNFTNTGAGVGQISSKLDLTAYGSDIVIRMSSSLTLLEIRLYKPVEPEPEPEVIDPFILNADSLTVGAVSEGTTYGNDYGTIEFTGTGNTVRNRPRDYTDAEGTKSWTQSFKNLKANIHATTYNKVILYVSNGSTAMTSVVTITNEDGTWMETLNTAEPGRAVTKMEFSLPTSGIYSISCTTGTADTHEIHLIKE